MKPKESALVASAISLFLLSAGYVTGGYVFYAAFALTIASMAIDYYQLRSALARVKRAITIDQRLSTWLVSPGQEVELSLQITNYGKSPLKFSLYQPLEPFMGPANSGEAIELAAGKQRMLDFRLVPSRCGDHAISPPLATVKSRLFTDSSPIGSQKKLTVRLDIGGLPGRTNASYHGNSPLMQFLETTVDKASGSEFSNVRKYMAGDNIKHIDWKLSAKSGDIIVREYENERVKPAYFLIDVDGSMGEGSGMSELDSAVHIASALTNRMMRMENEMTGLASFSRSDVVRYVRMGMGKSHIAVMKEALSAIKAIRSDPIKRRPSPMSMQEASEIKRALEKIPGGTMPGSIIEETLRAYAANIRDDGFARAIMKVMGSANTPCHLVIMTNLSMGIASLLNGIRLAEYYGHSATVILMPRIWYKEKGLIDTEMHYSEYAEIKSAIVRLRARSIKVSEISPTDKPWNLYYGSRINSRPTGIRG